MTNIEYIGNGEDKGKIHIKEYKQCCICNPISEKSR